MGSPPPGRSKAHATRSPGTPLPDPSSRQRPPHNWLTTTLWSSAPRSRSRRAESSKLSPVVARRSRECRCALRVRAFEVPWWAFLRSRLADTPACFRLWRVPPLERLPGDHQAAVVGADAGPVSRDVLQPLVPPSPTPSVAAVIRAANPRGGGHARVGQQGFESWLAGGMPWLTSSSPTLERTSPSPAC